MKIHTHDQIVIVKPDVFLHAGYDGKRVNGSIRRLYTESKPVLLGQIGTVTAITYIKTGIHRPAKNHPYHMSSYLENCIQHRILTIAFHRNGKYIGSIKIAEANVEQDADDQVRSIWDEVPSHG